MSNPGETLREMHAMLDLLSPAGPRLPFLSPATLDGHVVLVTGTTGFFGTGILAKLLESPDVRRIYAINRSSKDGTALEDRQKAAFKERGYDPTLVDLPKLVLVETSITESGLGVESRLEQDMRNSITHIIHNAWRVHFNLPISTYKPILHGMRVLVDFAISAPNMKRFIFISSAPIFNDVKGPTIPVAEIPLHDCSVVVRSGYTESKWVAEQMLYRTAKAFPAFRPLVVRVGILTGSPNGAWNTNAFFPAIVKSSLHPEMRCLPEYPGRCSWIPLDIAASTIIDFLKATENVDTAHLVHPIVQPTVNIMKWLGTIIDLPVVPLSEWIGKLELLASLPGIEHRHIPAVKLVSTFEDDARSNGFPSLILSTDVAVRLSGSLRQAEALSLADVVSWISYWARIGFLPADVAAGVRAHPGLRKYLSRL